MKIPICLVTGFLGTGKTTVLKHLVNRLKSHRVVYLINEFSATDIDGAIILGEGVDVIAVPGGSIFCKCLVTEFIGRLKEIPALYPDAEGVVIEASGMADPKVVEKMLSETGLDGTYELSTILTVVEPGSYMKLRYTLPNVIAQVQSADRVILNKIDLYDESQIKDCETALLEANPDVSIIRTANGIYSEEVFPAKPVSRGLSGEYALCKDPNYSSGTILFNGDSDITELKQAILARSEDLYRLKGFVNIQNRSHYIDFSSSGLVIKETEIQHSPGLAVIYKGNREHKPWHLKSGGKTSKQ